MPAPDVTAAAEWLKRRLHAEVVLRDAAAACRLLECRQDHREVCSLMAGSSFDLDETLLSWNRQRR